MKLRNFFTAVLFTGLVQTGYAQVVDFGDADLKCSLNRSQSIYIFAKDETVFLSNFSRDPVLFEINSFKTHRCPFCYEFSGTAEGERYDAVTEGFRDRDGKWDIRMDLNNEGTFEFPCVQP